MPLLHLKKRHLPACLEKHSRWPQYDRDTSHRCNCEVHASGSLPLDGFIRRSTGDHRWDRARAIADCWMDAGTWKAASPDVLSPGAISIDVACEQFIADREARNAVEATIKKYTQLLGSLKAFCVARGIGYLTEFGPDDARAFRESWLGAPVTNLKRLERMKSFFAFAAEQKWIEIDPAANVRYPKVGDAPADPLSEKEIADLLGAIERLPSRQNPMGHARVHCLILCLRYTGLRVSDIVRLGPQRITNGRLLVRMAKTGNPVMLKLPEFVTAKLGRLPLYAGDCYFAPAASKTGTATGNVRRTLRKLSKLADIRTANPHRFRDTLAIDLLSRGIPIEDVQQILGHEDVAITLRHYANWIPERQKRLDRAIAELG